MKAKMSPKAPTLLLVTLAVAAFAADPTSDSRFVIPVFRYSPTETSYMWIYNGGTQDIDVEAEVSGRNVNKDMDIEPLRAYLGVVKAGANKSFSSTDIINASGERLSLEETYNLALAMTLPGSDVFVRTAVNMLGLSLTLDAVKTYTISGAPATPAGRARFTLPVFPHRYETTGYFWVFNNGARTVNVDVTVSGRNTTQGEDITEPVQLSLGSIPKDANREFTSIDLIENSGGKLSLEYEYDFSVTIDTDSQDVHVIAVGDTGTGRMGFKVDKKFVRGPVE